jgi:hypothetical protein
VPAVFDGAARRRAKIGRALNLEGKR